MWQVEQLSSALEEERRLARAKDSRHKLTVERLRRQVIQLQVCCSATHWLLLHAHTSHHNSAPPADHMPCKARASVACLEAYTSLNISNRHEGLPDSFMLAER